MTLTSLAGTVKFKVAGQAAMPKWMQTALADALDNAEAPPEALRFQCRIATDARENFSRIELGDGETLSLHPKAKPQFGKNADGQAFLTTTLLYSGDGQGYSVRWVGDAVPRKMQEVAVKHDKGLAVRPAVISLDLADAQIQPAWKAHGRRSKQSKNEAVQAPARARYEEKVATGVKSRAKRNCARLTDADLGA